MNKLQALNKEINDLTLKIEQEHPELYQYLDENPDTIPSRESPDIDIESMTDYLESLKQILEHYEAAHK